MLVLGRKEDQCIRIGDDIVIRICQIKESTVRVGIEAPQEVRIIRGELEEAINHDQPLPVEHSHASREGNGQTHTNGHRQGPATFPSDACREPFHGNACDHLLTK